MITLGIETSCDETSCAVLENGDKILSNIVSSSLEKHQPFGGVVPEIASRHALENMRIVYDEAIKNAAVSLKDIELISVTYGPGLIGSLLVGISFAKSLAYERNLSLVGVNHLEAHLEANLIGNQLTDDAYIGLIVSGGNTIIVLYRDGKYFKLGGTVDDAVGEAYDKVAKLMGLGYPGGPVIDKLASKGDPKKYRFTKPKLDGELDFSFSGVKTAVLHLVENLQNEVDVEASNIASSFQNAVVSWLTEGVKKACVETGVKQVLVGGGVSANSLLRNRLKELGAEMGINVFIPPMSLTNDNAAMIAKSGYEKYRKGLKSGYDLSAMPNLRIGGL